jgi:hypothetical protein
VPPPASRPQIRSIDVAAPSHATVAESVPAFLLRRRSLAPSGPTRSRTLVGAHSRTDGSGSLSPCGSSATSSFSGLRHMRSIAKFVGSRSGQLGRRAWWWKRRSNRVLLSSFCGVPNRSSTTEVALTHQWVGGPGERTVVRFAASASAGPTGLRPGAALRQYGIRVFEATPAEMPLNVRYRSTSGRLRRTRAARANLGLECGELFVHLGGCPGFVQVLLDVVGGAPDVFEHAGLQ